MSENIRFYSQNATKLAAKYNSVTFESVHKEWLNHIPEEGFVLDVGAGSGRDARFLAAKGLSVVAVEPARGIREAAQQYVVDKPVHWINDRLPALDQVFALQTKFDLILLSAIWMHIAPSDRERSIRKLSSLLKANGKIIISLRHGESEDSRTMYPVSADELAKYARQFGLVFRVLTQDKQPDKLGRENVRWETVLLTLPDDGTGAFPLLRNVIVNDNKSSTYKIALLRSLLRIAEGHPGAVLDQSEGFVALPVGLVALYWLKLFKPLVDVYQMSQSGNASKGLGFVQDDGWKKISKLTGNDFYIGAHYSCPELAKSLYQTLKDIAKTIKQMPVKYITMPGGKDSIFQVELTRTKQPTHSLTFDADFFSSMGSFYIPQHVWDALTRFSVWIEPSLVNEWAVLMSRYEGNKVKNFSKLDYLNALSWEDPNRSTYRVRNRVKELLFSEQVVCCWSGGAIRTDNFAVDHALPFSRWPNNDLWNLLPAKSRVNSKKADKLATSQRLFECQQLITSWWRQAWGDQKQEFFIQANLALPNLSSDNDSFHDVFDSLVMQRDRIKDFQQLEDW